MARYILAVEIVIIIIVKVALGRTSSRSIATLLTVGEPEVGAEPSGLLESLAEHLVFLDIVVRHGPNKH